MKLTLYRLAVVILIFLPPIALAQVTIQINDKFFEYDKTLSLAEVIRPMSDIGEWYWPMSALYRVNEQTVTEKKQKLLAVLKNLESKQSNDLLLQKSIATITKQIESWQLAERILIPINYERARIKASENPKLPSGNYLLKLSERKSQVELVGLWRNIGEHTLGPAETVSTLLETTAITRLADKDHVYVVLPTGEQHKVGIAYWNREHFPLMPGSQIYAPIQTKVFDSDIDALNQQVLDLIRHRVLEQ